MLGTIEAHRLFVPTGGSTSIGILPSSSTWSLIASMGNIFVTLANSTSGARSIDGINWSTITLPTTAWKSLAANNSRFVALSGYTTTAYMSLDGITWNSYSMPNNTYGYSCLCWDGTYFIAMPHGSTNNGAISTDGITWTVIYLPFVSGYITFGSVTSNGSRIVTTGISSTNELFYYSDDHGSTWTLSRSIAGGQFYQITSNGTSFAAMVNSGGHYGEFIYESNTGSGSWSQITLPALIPTTAHWQSITATSGRYVIFSDNLASTGHVATSTNNGTTWIVTILPINKSFVGSTGNGINYSATINPFVAVGSGSSSSIAISF